MLPNEPKRTHLTRLHNSAILLGSKIQADNAIYLLHYNNETDKFVNGTEQLAYVYDNDSGRTVFIQNSATVEVIVAYVTVHAKTSLVRTKIEINFLSPAYTH